MKLIILGAGGYGHTIADVAEQLEYSILFFDDSLPGHELSTFSSYIYDDTEFIPAFGNNEFRLEWLTRLESAGVMLATLIHTTAYVSPRASIAHGTVILPHAVVNTGVVINRGCIINFGALINHDCVIEEGVHMCLGAIVKSENRIPFCIKIEASEVVERGQYPL